MTISYYLLFGDFAAFFAGLGQANCHRLLAASYFFVALATFKLAFLVFMDSLLDLFLSFWTKLIHFDSNL